MELSAQNTVARARRARVTGRSPSARTLRMHQPESHNTCARRWYLANQQVEAQRGAHARRPSESSFDATRRDSRPIATLACARPANRGPKRFAAAKIRFCPPRRATASDHRGTGDGAAATLRIACGAQRDDAVRATIEPTRRRPGPARRARGGVPRHGPALGGRGGPRQRAAARGAWTARHQTRVRGSRRSTGGPG